MCLNGARGTAHGLRPLQSIWKIAAFPTARYSGLACLRAPKGGETQEFEGGFDSCLGQQYPAGVAAPFASVVGAVRPTP